MLLKNEFEVDAAPERVWALLTDPERVMGCLPDATPAEQTEGCRAAGQ